MLVAGNWKMNTDFEGALELAEAVADAVGEPGEGVDVAVCPPAPLLLAVLDTLGESDILLGAQTMHEADSGAYTGESSASMLTSVGCVFVILGHSERRQYFGETDDGVGRKVTQALAHELVPIVCVGETLAEREAGDAEAVVLRQLSGAFGEMEALAAPDAVVVAYEPVWAIGTGRTASPDDAQAMHAAIRAWMTERFGETGADVELLYGGSVKPGNASELFAQPDIDGGLIGGASLDASSFAAIVRAAEAAVDAGT
ncbi:MAG: triose-phosphate isomerase [Bacteroidota bacterium]